MKTLILSSLLIVIFFTACSKQEKVISTDSTAVKQDSVAVDENEVSLQPKFIEVSSKNPQEIHTFTMNNSTQQNIITGEYFEIKELKEGQWETLSIDLFFNEIGYRIPAHGKKEFKIVFPKSLDLKPGSKYRLYKNYVLEDFNKRNAEKKEVFLDLIINN